VGAANGEVPELPAWLSAYAGSLRRRDIYNANVFRRFQSGRQSLELLQDLLRDDGVSYADYVEQTHLTFSS